MDTGIFKAKQVVVLADASAVTQNANQHLSGSAAGLDALVDTDAIFCYQAVRRMNEQVRARTVVTVLYCCIVFACTSTYSVHSLCVFWTRSTDM